MRLAVPFFGRMLLLLGLLLMGGCDRILHDLQNHDGDGGGETVTFTVDIEVVPPTGGTVGGAGTYSEGDEALLTASAASGYEFSGWSGDISSTAASYPLTVDQDYSVTAEFVETYTISIDVSPAGAGTVGGEGTYRVGHDALLSATAAAGYEFSGWSGFIDSGDNPYSFAGEGSGAVSITAEFRAVGAAPEGWAWMAGPSTNQRDGVYGTKGVSDPANYPGGREFPRMWSDPSGVLWMYGGYGYNNTAGTRYFTDMWSFDPSSAEWTWVSGSADAQDALAYGPVGSFAPSYTPGFRTKACSAADGSGNLYLFGGNSGGWQFLGDLWKFDTAIGQWALAGGTTAIAEYGVYGVKGTPAAGNRPGAREQPAGWTDASGNFWVFGGYGYDASESSGPFNDLWKFDKTLGQWSWESGSGDIWQDSVCGSIGVAAPGNVPGSRLGASPATDASGNLWFFGGYGYGTSAQRVGSHSDLWKFDPSTGQWSCMSALIGANNPGVYGTLGVANPANVPGGRNRAACWFDAEGRFWLFGGYGYDLYDSQGPLNDLWMYSPATGMWTWVAGSEGTYGYGTRGPLGVTDLAFSPSARSMTGYAADPAGKLWLFGGSGKYPWMGDLWRFSPPPAP